MTAMRTVFMEGKLAGDVDLAELTDLLMDALVDRGAMDPFVYTDASVPSFRVEITVDAASDVQALGVGVGLLAEAVTAAGVAIEAPSARSAELVSA